MLFKVAPNFDTFTGQSDTWYYTGTNTVTISLARNELLTKFQRLESSIGKWLTHQRVRIIPFPVETILFPVLPRKLIITISLARNELLTKFQSLKSSIGKWLSH